MGASGLISSIFGGGGVSSPKVATYEPAPVREAETEAVAKSVREDEQRKLKGRRAMSGTVLTSPLGIANSQNAGKGILGGGFTGEG